MTFHDFEEGVRTQSYRYAHFAEVVLHSVLALLLAVGAAAALYAACSSLWHGLVGGTVAPEALLVIDQLLLVLIFIEILHTVRLSIRSESLLMEPFLIVGVIASVRRMLVITMQVAHASGEVSTDQFHRSMIEMGVLGLLILILVFSIFLLRGRPPATVESASR